MQDECVSPRRKGRVAQGPLRPQVSGRGPFAALCVAGSAKSCSVLDNGPIPPMRESAPRQEKPRKSGRTSIPEGLQLPHRPRGGRRTAAVAQNPSREISRTHAHGRHDHHPTKKEENLRPRPTRSLGEKGSMGRRTRQRTGPSSTCRVRKGAAEHRPGGLPDIPRPSFRRPIIVRNCPGSAPGKSRPTTRSGMPLTKASVCGVSGSFRWHCGPSEPNIIIMRDQRSSEPRRCSRAEDAGAGAEAAGKIAEALARTPVQGCLISQV